MQLKNLSSKLFYDSRSHMYIIPPNINKSLVSIKQNKSQSQFAIIKTQNDNLTNRTCKMMFTDRKHKTKLCVMDGMNDTHEFTKGINSGLLERVAAYIMATIIFKVTRNIP